MVQAYRGSRHVAECRWAPSGAASSWARAFAPSSSLKGAGAHRQMAKVRIDPRFFVPRSGTTKSRRTGYRPTPNTAELHLLSVRRPCRRVPVLRGMPEGDCAPALLTTRSPPSPCPPMDLVPPAHHPPGMGSGFTG